MILQKWNYQTHKYEPYESPAMILDLYSESMVEPVDCANCGKRITYGDSFTSMTIHASIGLGYPVCEACYQEEMKERFSK